MLSLHTPCYRNPFLWDFCRQSIVSETLFGLYSLGTGYWLEIKQRPFRVYFK